MNYDFPWCNVCLRLLRIALRFAVVIEARIFSIGLVRM